ncbi:MAG: cytochrome c oxidase subunit II [Phycisphaeraceae bacterium]
MIPSGVLAPLFTLASAASGKDTTGPRGWWLPIDVSTTGPDIDALFNFILILTGVVCIAVFALMILFMIRYRHQPGRHGKFIHGNNRLELAWTLIPTLILAGTAAVSQKTWSEIKNIDRMPKPGPEVTQVNVIAQQFLWNFQYAGADGQFGPTLIPALVNVNGAPPEQIGLNRDTNLTLKNGKMLRGKITGETDDTITLVTKERDAQAQAYVDHQQVYPKADILARDQRGADDLVGLEMVIPVKRKVLISLSSRDVIHSFFLPNLRVKQDAVPGLTGKVWFEATRTSAAVIGTIDPDTILGTPGQEREKYLDQVMAGSGADEALRPVLKRLLVDGAEFDELELDQATLDKLPWAFVRMETVVGYAKPFDIVCAELCGLSHYKMSGKLYVVTQPKYEAFLAQQRSLGGFTTGGDGEDEGY